LKSTDRPKHHIENKDDPSMQIAKQAATNYLLIEERKKHHWTQQEVADYIGTTPITISRWEHGIYSPGLHSRAKICALFAKSEEELGLRPPSENMHFSVPLLSQPLIETPCNQNFTVPASLLMIPFERNPFFTGRGTILSQLLQFSQSESNTSSSSPLALSGMGGSGKTQVAIEFAYHVQADYQAVFWVQADNQSNFLRDIEIIGRHLHLSPSHPTEPACILRAMIDWLSTHQSWLLILDHVDDFTIIHRLLSFNYPETSRILLTTQSRWIGTLARSITIDPLDRETATLFLLRRTKCIDPHAPLTAATVSDIHAARTIVEITGQLPLDLDQVATYIDEVGCGLTRYLDVYKLKQEKLLKRYSSRQLDYSPSINTALPLIIEKLEYTHPAAVDLLRFCAFLHPDEIPEEIVIRGALTLPSACCLDLASPLILDEIFVALRMYSLLQRNANTKMFAVHKTIQSIIKGRMSQETQQIWIDRVIQTVSSSLPDKKEIADWLVWKRLLSQALSCIMLIDQWNIFSQEAFQLLNKVGSYLGWDVPSQEVFQLLSRTGGSLHLQAQYQEAMCLFMTEFNTKKLCWEIINNLTHPKLEDESCDF
jgi:transcriptional regulator with XRE-family HTH domain